MSAFEFAGLLVNALFEGVGPGEILVVFRVKLAAHAVKGFGELSDFVFGLDLNLEAEISGGQALGSAFQCVHRNSNYPPDEEPAQDGDQQQCAASVDNHAAAAFGQLHVRFGEGKVGVENAQNLLLGGMRVAGGVGTCRLVLDGSDDAEHTSATSVPEDAKAVGPVELCQRLGLGVAGVAGFRTLIDNVIQFGGIGRVGYPAFFVEDADLCHARLIGEGADGMVKTFAVIAKHVIGGAVLDDVADAFGA